MFKSSNSRKKKSTGVSRIKTGSFERKLSLTRTGLMVGTRMTGHLAASFFTPKNKREEKRKQALSRQAQYLVEDLGRLKGSVVKIGQVMALYGEHFLPPEVTEALHTLEENTVALDWSVIREVLFHQLGKERMAQLEVEQVPIGTASLGQVHCARIIETNEIICLKVQYPGVAQAVDTDLDAVAQLLKIARVVTFGPAFDDWLEEVRAMMHREVDYHLEAETTAHFRELLKGDARFVVPKVYFEFSTDQVLATSFELGENISSPLVSRMSQARRNTLAQASLGLFLQELFVWHEIQTDPNFGNYRIRIGESGQSDQIVLLDFGAVQKYPESFITPICKMISSAYISDVKGVVDGGIALRFMSDSWPESVLIEFAQVCIAVLEPLAKNNTDAGENAFNEFGEYCWRTSDLPTRIAKRAAVSAISRYFKIPPKEFVFLNRKLVGVYTFISVLDGQFNGSEILAPYVEKFMNEISL
ncbi:MAG: putative unusual protein kinase regulating ubiquinone biosynthesis (AarF/ABC1/UbiB family) [Oleiphilaceae bacterium]|jgi:predicted unusual protein kinase regulating ubiquinone biosynthesis (AarF/ABC1/UbiB family)